MWYVHVSGDEKRVVGGADMGPAFTVCGRRQTKRSEEIIKYVTTALRKMSDIRCTGCCVGKDEMEGNARVDI